MARRIVTLLLANHFSAVASLLATLREAVSQADSVADLFIAASTAKR
ncbi:hypothetical protein E7V67_010445 [[Empedobacter] haloabium]|uniref:Uncharacterized protein n=1 Tax=[Empedobacter] haloabium TaxID=592317 RepID=A0ABZ1UU60_9BURK